MKIEDCIVGPFLTEKELLDVCDVWSENGFTDHYYSKYRLIKSYQRNLEWKSCWNISLSGSGCVGSWASDKGKDNITPSEFIWKFGKQQVGGLIPRSESELPSSLQEAHETNRLHEYVRENRAEVERQLRPPWQDKKPPGKIAEYLRNRNRLG